MFLMLQKTFFASKGTKNLVEYPKPGRDFSTKSRKRSGERRSGAGNRTHAARGKKRPAAPISRQTGRERLYAGPARPEQGIEGAARSMRAPARRTHQPGWRERTPHGRSPAQKRTPHGKEPRTEGTPHGRNPAQGKAPHKQEKIPHGRMSRIEKKPRPREYFARKKSRTKGTRPGDRFAHEKIPRGSGKYQR